MVLILDTKNSRNGGEQTTTNEITSNQELINAGITNIRNLFGITHQYCHTSDSLLFTTIPNLGMQGGAEVIVIKQIVCQVELKTKTSENSSAPFNEKWIQYSE